MVAVSENLGNVWSALVNIAKDGGASIMFVGLEDQQMVSDTASAFAQLCEKRAAKAVWLLDLDIFANRQYNSFQFSGAPISKPFDMTFGLSPFWRIVPAGEAKANAAIVGHRIGNSKLFVSKFRPEALAAGQAIQMSPSPQYWSALRNSIDFVVVDAPVLDKSRAALALVSDMDGVVLIIDPDNSQPQQILQLRDEIIERGGNCIGIILVEGKKTNKSQPVYDNASINDIA